MSLFARYCGNGGQAGVYQADAVQTGMTGFYSEPTGWVSAQYDSAIWPEGNVSLHSYGYSDSFIIAMQDFGVVVDHKRYTINQRFADKTRPENVSLPIALYLGRSAQV